MGAVMNQITLYLEPGAPYSDDEIWVNPTLLIPGVEPIKEDRSGILKATQLEQSRTSDNWPGTYLLLFFTPSGLSIKDLFSFHLNDIPANIKLELDVENGSLASPYLVRINRESLSFRIWFDTTD